MKTHLALGLAAALAALSAGAQTTAPSDTVPRGAPVVSDSAPPPAEDRDSSGAVVVDPARRAAPGVLERPETRSLGAGPAARPLTPGAPETARDRAERPGKGSAVPAQK